MTDAEVRKPDADETVMKKPYILRVARATRPSTAMLVELLALYAQGK